MHATAGPKSAHAAKRQICALLAVGFIAALFIEIVTSLRTGRVPTVGNLVGSAAGLPGAYILGLYAFKGQGGSELGVLSEPSERVRNLASRPDSKIDAIKAYRQQTWVGVKRGKEVVERLASLDRSKSNPTFQRPASPPAT